MNTWKDLVLGIIALVAAFVWPTIAELNPPFDAAGWESILVWLGGLLLAVFTGWKFQRFALYTNDAMRTYYSEPEKQTETPDWLKLVLGVVALVAAFVWPSVAPFEPPFDAGLFSDIMVWIVTVVLTAIFGWNMAALKKL